MSGFLYIKKFNANCLAFFEESGFLYIKTSRNANFHAFCTYINANFKKFKEKLRNVNYLGFMDKKVTQNVLLFAKCLAFCTYI